MSSTPTAFVPSARAEPRELATERHLHRNIPLTAAMGVRVLLATPTRVELAAPLAPNINHASSVFGGSASAVATLAAWTLVHVGLDEANVDATIVIQRNQMSYDEPIHGDFRGVCTLSDAAAWQRFLHMIERRGRGRIALQSELLFEGRVAGSFEGEFVALRR